MIRYLARRTILGLGMLLLVSVLVFFFTQALPGDVVRQVLGQTATEQQIALMRSQLGLDRPLPAQYFSWLFGLVRGDLGISLTSRLPVLELIAPRLLVSSILILVTSAILIPLALVLGAAAARKPGGTIDTIVSTSVLLILALPEFIVAILVVVILATNFLHVLPPTSIIRSGRSLIEQADLFVLPVLALVVGSLPYTTESIKTAIREELSGEYVMWARLSGIGEARILWRHVLPNALPPSLQVAATTLIYLMGGIVAVENVFAFPGIGSALTEAVAHRDIPVVQTIAMLLAFLAFLVYLAADIAGVLLTPRLRTEYTS